MEYQNFVQMISVVTFQRKFLLNALYLHLNSGLGIKNVIWIYQLWEKSETVYFEECSLHFIQILSHIYSLKR